MDERLAAAHTMASEFRHAESRVVLRPLLRRSLTLEGTGLATLEDDLRMRERLASSGIGYLPPLPSGPTNFLSRVLRPSLPVVHVAFAAAQLVEQGTKALRQGPTELQARHGIRLKNGGYVGDFLFGTLLKSDEFGELLLDRAEGLEALLPLLEPCSKQIVRIRLEPQSHGVIGARLVIADYAAEADRACLESAIEVPREGDPSLLAATMLAAASCVPPDPDDPTLAEEVAALCRLDWQRRLDKDPSLAERLVVANLRHLTMQLVRARAIEKRINRALRTRLRAARILAPAVQAAVSGLPPPAHSSGKAWSLAGAIRRELEQDGTREAAGETSGGGRHNRARVTNIEVRVVKPSRPVLPLAIAILFVQQQRAHSAGQPFSSLREVDIVALFEAPAEVAAILKLALDLEKATCALPAGGPTPETLVRVRVTDQA